MKRHENNHEESPTTGVSSAYQMGRDPEKDAWFNTFFIENHLDYFTHPDQAATPEQVRFMVYLEEDERYYPCSDRMFEAIMSRKESAHIQREYNDALSRILELIHQQIENRYEEKYLETLIRIKFEHETKDEIMIPSRLEKRLMRILLNHTQIEDPYIFEKAARNRRASSVLNSEAFNRAMNKVDLTSFSDHPTRLTEVRQFIEQIEIKRLFNICVENDLWKSNKANAYEDDDFLKLFKRPVTGNGVDSLLHFLGISGKDSSPGTPYPKKILWLVNEAGEIMIDLFIIRYLVKLGHQIIISFKEGSLYAKVNVRDAQEDEWLRKELGDALWINEKDLSKNELVKTLRTDRHIIAISDGTRENINLLLTSTTFARVFREVDGIISKGHDLWRRFFDTHFQFTQDIYNISKNRQGSVEISYKPRHPSVIKLSHGDLEKKANKIIDQMKEAKQSGMTVIFYSAIIGSIPGKIQMAKKILFVFIENLKKQFAETFIINPSEYYEPGMDADDLMFMWEIVQTSGYIDIWRFQTYEDIVQAFQSMGEKVPPEWVGKDATYSTGCTKEMRIALDVQQKHPEMQIIGPSREKFMRRDEYGVGKMYDKRLS
ncbi:ARMT1-like domain-containing protein [Thermodesulfobacteriota bacterium]